jgi:hypothetical protein
MTLTMQSLHDLGFGLIRSYPHDEFITQVYEKGRLKVERTFKNYTIHSQEVIIGGEYFEVDFQKLVLLDKILNGCLVESEK